MKIIRSGRQLFFLTSSYRRHGQTIGFVPTMGYLHEGHLSLLRRARRKNECIVASIFVNPAQFGPGEDFRQYPRDIQRDIGLCETEKVDFLFLPRASAVYPPGFQTYVEPGPLAKRLCGKSRPGHFRGVATVVTKLFNWAQPTIAYFGQKDYQQALIIRRLAADLNLPVKIKICPIVRDRDGLALSSRNTYLDADGRRKALALVRALRWFREEVKKGRRDANLLKIGVRKILAQNVSRIDYAEILDAQELSPVRRLSGRIVLVLAAFVPAAGSGPKGRQVRLIDNCLVKVP